VRDPQTLTVIIPSIAGFCFGVERALSLLDEALKKAKAEGKKVFSFGAIIHNEAVIQKYRERGVIFTERIDELLEKAAEGDYVIIRSHGIPKQTLKTLKESGLTLLEGTCPYVKKIHKIVEEASSLGRQVIIFGKHSIIQRDCLTF